MRRLPSVGERDEPSRGPVTGRVGIFGGGVCYATYRFAIGLPREQAAGHAAQRHEPPTNASFSIAVRTVCVDLPAWCRDPSRASGYRRH